MANVQKVNKFSDGEDISTVTYYKLVVLSINGTYTNVEFKKRPSFSKAAMAKFDKNHKRLRSFNQDKS
jgi:hypothetical protein